jgi:hypothetical protein
MQKTFGQGSLGRFNPTATNSWGDKIANRSGAEDVVSGTSYFQGYATGNKYYTVAPGTATQVNGGKNNRNNFVDKNFDAVFGRGNFWQNFSLVLKI